MTPAGQHSHSSRKAVPAIHIEYSASRRLRYTLYGTLLFGAGMILVLTITASPWYAGLYGVLIPAAWRYYHWHISGTSSKAVKSLHRHSDGRWLMVLRSGESRAQQLLGDSIVLPAVMVLKFKDQATGARRSVVIMPDSISPDLYRRACVNLLTVQAVSG